MVATLVFLALSLVAPASATGRTPIEPAPSPLIGTPPASTTVGASGAVRPRRVLPATSTLHAASLASADTVDVAFATVMDTVVAPCVTVML